MHNPLLYQLSNSHSSRPCSRLSDSWPEHGVQCWLDDYSLWNFLPHHQSGDLLCEHADTSCGVATLTFRIQNWSVQRSHSDCNANETDQKAIEIADDNQDNCRLPQFTDVCFLHQPGSLTIFQPKGVGCVWPRLEEDWLRIVDYAYSRHNRTGFLHLHRYLAHSHMHGGHTNHQLEHQCIIPKREASNQRHQLDDYYHTNRLDHLQDHDRLLPWETIRIRQLWSVRAVDTLCLHLYADCARHAHAPTKRNVSE